MHDLKWSQPEKIAARRAFDHALNTELQQLIPAAKQKAADVTQAPALWQLERWLTKRRIEIDRKYDYRYSMLPFVFATLMRERRITEDDLQGLHPEKIELIRTLASRF